MHSYLRAIGFQNNMKKSDIEKLTDKIVSSPDRIEVSEDSMGNEFVEMTKEIAPGAGIRVCGEYAEDGTFHTEYYYPYVEGDGITTQEQIEIEKHSEKESYAGVCDEMKLGVTLIFYLQNVAEYLSEHHRNPKMRPMSATLSALSLNGKIIMPISKNEKQIQNTKKNSQDRNYLIAAAREGDEDAISAAAWEAEGCLPASTWKFRNAGCWTAGKRGRAVERERQGKVGTGYLCGRHLSYDSCPENRDATEK